MENSKLYQLIVFAFCSAVNDNLSEIYYMYNKKVNNESITKINKVIKGIAKDLFK